MNHIIIDRNCITLEVEGDVCERMRKSNYVCGAFMNPESTRTYVVIPMPSFKFDGDLFIKTAEEKLKIKSVSFHITPAGTKLVFCPPPNHSN
jgi:hypothetical protein